MKHKKQDLLCEGKNDDITDLFHLSSYITLQIQSVKVLN